MKTQVRHYYNKLYWMVKWPTKKMAYLAVSALLLSGVGVAYANQPRVETKQVSVHQTHVYKPKLQPPQPQDTPQPTKPSSSVRSSVAPAKTAPVTSGRACVAPTGFEAGVNQVRAQHGLAALCVNASLRQAALARANYMCQTNTFNHAGFYAGQVNAYYSSPTGLTGENISAGLYSGDGQVVQEFVNSPEHYANMVNPSYTEQGAASIMCAPPYCTIIGICGSPVPVQINVNDFGG